MIAGCINTRQHEPIRGAQLRAGTAVPVTATPTVAAVAVGVAAVVSGFGWAYGW